MTQWFDGGIVSYQIRSRKPAREGFSAILRAFHARPEEAIYIDDSERNVASARRLGIHGIRYTSLRGLRREIEAISDRFKKGAALPNCKRFSA
jgi:FMN phosphatase YigB (HAD superfamily)